MATDEIPPKDECTPIEDAFARAFVEWHNKSRAFRAVTPAAREWKDTTVASSAWHMANRPRVAARIRELRAEAHQAHKDTIADLVAHARAIVEADPSELIERRVGCCRRCWGVGHAFQRTPREYTEAWTKYAHDLVTWNIEIQGPLPMFEDGGDGYNANKAPNPACPECFGDGVARTVTKDTRTLSPGAALLYAGVKETRDGIEIKIQDQGAWADRLAKMTGAFVERRELSGPNGAPIPTANVGVALTTDDPQVAAKAYGDLMRTPAA